MLDVDCDPRGVASTKQWSRPETNASSNTLLVEETPNALVVAWVGNGARCVSRDLTLHRLSAYSSDSMTLHLSTAVCIIQGTECLRVIHVLSLSFFFLSLPVLRTIRRFFRFVTSHKKNKLCRKNLKKLKKFCLRKNMEKSKDAEK